MNYRIHERLARGKSSTLRGNYRGIGRANLTALALVALVAFGLMSAMRAEAATITVCASGCNYTHIGDAVNASTTVDGDTISIQAGTYDEANITIGENLTIEGQGAASTIVDGGEAGRIFLIDPGVTATLKDLTIQNGTSGSGGGVFNKGNLTVDHCTFQDNTATNGGPAGGAIFNNNDATLKATNSTFSGNNGYLGGAIYNNSGSNGKLTVTNCTFSDNQNFSTGKGINVPSFEGGAIYNNVYSILIATNSTFSSNHAHYGGAIDNDGGARMSATATVTNCTFANNTATGAGGAIEDGNGATLFVTNCTFSGNQGGYFGAGGIDVFSYGVVDVKSSILAAQTSFGNCSNDGTVTIHDEGYNIDDDGSCGFSATGSVSDYTTGSILSIKGLTNNGGPTKTIALDTSNSSNPAIDAIPLADCTDQSSPTPEEITTDQRGYTRPDEGESACDMGAYESGAAGPLTLSSKTKLELEPSTGSFDLYSGFTPTTGSTIDPVHQQVTLQIGSYSVTIPIGSFVKNKKGDYVFQGVINGVSLQVRIAPTKDGYTLQAEGSNADLSGITGNPVTVTLTIGGSSGSTPVNAQFS